MFLLLFRVQWQKTRFTMEKTKHIVVLTEQLYDKISVTAQTLEFKFKFSEGVKFILLFYFAVFTFLDKFVEYNVHSQRECSLQKEKNSNVFITRLRMFEIESLISLVAAFIKWGYIVNVFSNTFLIEIYNLKL